MIKIVCVKWGTLFPSDYVNKLYYGVKRNTTVPFEFYCFTEDPKGIDSNIKVLPIGVNNLKKQWNKMYLFHPDNGLSGNVLFLDLDVLITSNIDDFLQPRENFTIMSNYIFTNNNPQEKGILNSSMYLFDHAKMTYMWDVFVKNMADVGKLKGDQWFLSKHLDHSKVDIFQELFPGKLKSYKLHCYENGPDGTSIIHFHGPPRPHEAVSKPTMSSNKIFEPRAWIKDYWRTGE